MCVSYYCLLVMYIQEGTNALLLSIFRKQPQVIRALMARHPNVDLVDEVYTLVYIMRVCF